MQKRKICRQEISLRYGLCKRPVPLLAANVHDRRTRESLIELHPKSRDITEITREGLAGSLAFPAGNPLGGISLLKTAWQRSAK